MYMYMYMYGRKVFLYSVMYIIMYMHDIIHCFDLVHFVLDLYTCDLHNIISAGGALGWMSGVVNLALSWRWTFHILGIAGLVMTPVAVMAVYEPKTVRLKRKERMKGKTTYTILVSNGMHATLFRIP